MTFSKLLSALFLMVVYTGQAQTSSDQLFMSNGEKFDVTVKKIEPKTITYVFLGEEMENIVEKESVLKIIFKNGREQHREYHRMGKSTVHG